MKTFRFDFDELCTIGNAVDFDMWEWIRHLSSAGKRVEIVSHLSESFRPQLVRWLQDNYVEYHELQMGEEA